MDNKCNTSSPIREFTYVIIGGGIAGVSCVEQILEFEQDAEILLISSSPVVKEASNIKRLTKTLQDFIVIEKTLKSFKDVHLSVCVLHDDMTFLDPTLKKLTTKGGESFMYKKVCICTGASPKVIFPKHERILGIRDTESVEKLAARVSKAKQIVLIGNGGIATEFVHEAKGVDIIWSIKDKSISAHYMDAGAAEFFIQAEMSAKENHKVASGSDVNTDCDSSDIDVGAGTPEPCKRMKYTISSTRPKQETEIPVKNPFMDFKLHGSALGPDWSASVALRGDHSSKNVTIEYETECKCILSPEEFKALPPNDISEIKEEWPLYIELTNGKVYGCDLIISATGVIPNCEWFPGSFDPSEGVRVDDNLRTSLPHVFAAGDVCYPGWTWAKHWFQMRLWTQARQMGLFAGKSMVWSRKNDEVRLIGSEAEELDLDFCFELFSHVTRFFGFKVVLLGLYNGQGLDKNDQHLLIRCTKNVEYIKVVLVDWRMQGAILIGDTGLEETFENLILNQVDLSPYGEDLLNPDIDIEDFFD